MPYICFFRGSNKVSPDSRIGLPPLKPMTAASSDRSLEVLKRVVKVYPCDHLNTLSTPSFKKFLTEVGEVESIDSNLFYLLLNYVKNLDFSQKIWKGVPMDYFHTNRFTLSAIELYNIRPLCQEWLSASISAKSFLNMVQTCHFKYGTAQTRVLYRDSFRQLNYLLCDEEIELPRKWRWRLVDFHDKVSQLYLDRTLSNVIHCREFIPTPVQMGEWVISQPRDTLELATWGRRVRNCVLSREDAIISQQSAIFLIEEGGKPEYTVEVDYLPLKEGRVEIIECKGLANRVLGRESEELCRSLVARGVDASQLN